MYREEGDFLQDGEQKQQPQCQLSPSIYSNVPKKVDWREGKHKVNEDIDDY